MKITTLLIHAMFWLPVAAPAQDALLDQPGYVDFGDLSGVTASEPTVEISIGGVLLSFLAEATRKEDQELADTLGKLRSIRVSVFDLNAKNVDEARAHAESIGRQLESRAWESAVVVRAENSTVRMYLKTLNGQVAGMAVMAIEPGSDAIFMNIVGNIDPQQLGRVASKFGVSLNDLGKTDG